MKENGNVYVPSEDQNAIAYKLANWHRAEFIPANSQMCYPDRMTTGGRAMCVRFPVPQDEDGGHLAVEAEIP